MKTYKRLLLILAVTTITSTLFFIGSTTAQKGRSSPGKPTVNRASNQRNNTANEQKSAAARRSLQEQEKGGGTEIPPPSYSTAVAFAETPEIRDLKPELMVRSKKRSLLTAREDREKNETNRERIRPLTDPNMTAPFIDPTLKASESIMRSIAPGSIAPGLVTNPIANFDGHDMDAGAILLGRRFAPPDTNAAVGPNHVVLATNAGFQVFTKAGVAVTPLLRISSVLVGIPNAADDNGDPIVLYDSLADRWMISQFNLRTTSNRMHQHIAVSKTSDPAGAYYAYDFLTTVNRPHDYPHFGVWPDGYYMSTNDFSLPVFSNPFQGAGLYAFERAKMLVGDPTAKIIGFNTNNLHGGMLPTNFQGYTPPPAGTPNLFMEFDADEFGAATDLVRTFAFHADFAVPANSTLTQGPDIPTVPFDARQPATRATIAQPAPGEGLDAIADRLMHALNFRVLPGGVQSYVLNFTVNVSGVNPTSAATYQGGVRWMELRRNAGTGAVTINQQATYAPGSGNPTGRDLWMAAVAQDGEGNIALAANATNSTATPSILNPTAIYTGRLAGDPASTLPQGETDAMSAVVKGVQTSTVNRWGDYSSLFVDPSDDCTFWGAFEYVDSPTATFDWNTRIFSFKVNPTCVTPQKGNLAVTVTNCETGLPIENATVTLDGNFYGATIANGTYGTVLPPGGYNYSITKPTFNVVSGNTTINNGATTNLNVCLNGIPSIGSDGTPALIQESCPPVNAAVDPGETVTVHLNLRNTGAASTTNLVATLQPSANVLAPSGPQNYGAIAPGASAGRDFAFTANGNCGDTITLNLALQDGANNLGTASFQIRLGVVSISNSTFSNSTAITIPNGAPTTTIGAANPYPSNIAVAGIGDPVTKVTVRLNGLSHTWPDDLDVLLVGPSGQKVMLTSDAGDGVSYDLVNANLIFDDAAATGVPDEAEIPSNATTSYKPTDVGTTDTLPVPAPGRPFAPTLAAFNGLNPNGTWSLYIADDSSLDVGSVSTGWSITFTTESVSCNTACVGAPRIATTVALSCNSSQVRAIYTVTNSGTATANNVSFTTAKIGAVNGTPLPQNLGNLAPGQSAQATVDFTGAPSGVQIVSGGGTYTGGSFTIQKKATVPTCNPASPTIGTLIFRWVPPTLTDATLSFY